MEKRRSLSMKRRLLALLVALSMLLVSAAMAETVTGTGTAAGFGGEITVTITLTDGVITAVEAVGDGETNGIGGNIIKEWPDAFVEANGIVDTYSGATFAGVTRTAFIEAARAALTDAGVDPDDYMREMAVEEAEDVTLEADIVIVGAGGAGMTAAITAADEGMTVVVLESQPAVGGNSVKSTGGMNAAKTADQDENEFAEAAGVEKTLAAAAANYADNEAVTELAAAVQAQWDAYQADPQGYFDSTELFALDTMIGGKGINDPELVNTLVGNSADAIEWLRTQNIDLTNVASFGGASVKRIHRPLNDEGKVVSVGAYTVPLLETAMNERENVTLLLDTTATEILVGEDGAAVGVVAVGKTGNTVTVNAPAVVLTTGGFGANLDMVTEFAPQLDGFMTTNAAGIQGQGIAMAKALGADTVDMEQIQIHPTVQADTASLITEGLRGDGAILVNANGERFIDEVGTRDVVSAAEIAQPGSFSWLIVDQKMVDASSVIQGYISRGLMFTGETSEALAGELGIPADAFAATLETWNGYVAEKNDPDFNRTSFAQPLDTAPYYAVKVTAGIHHTMGGLKIDSETHVIDTEGEIIPGLFAAGEVTGGVHGANRLGGNAVADFVVFGRIAGAEAAAYAQAAVEEAA
ncbi:MAG: flavocytochrome c [Clostridia bacterium]|nr:flavocytochrome c [Clostridia bacterium]